MADPAYIVDGVLTDGEAWVAVDSDVLTGTATSITWTSTDDGQVGDWSQYLDMVIICYVRTDGTGNSYVKLGFNNLTTDLFDTCQFEGDGATDASSSNSEYTYNFIGKAGSALTGAPANCFAAIVCHVMDINASKYKNVLSYNAVDMDTTDADESRAMIYSSTWGAADATGLDKHGPISRMDLGIFGGTNFVAGCRFDLFGVLPRMVA